MRQIGLLAISFLALVTAACSSGGSGDGSNPAPVASPSTGVFIDGPVQGLGYRTTPSAMTGVTDAAGQYNYMDGDDVVFSLYGRVIGSPIPAGPVATPLSIFNATSMTDPRVINLAQLLLTLQGGLPPVGTSLQVPTTPPAGFPATLNFSAAGFDTSIPGLPLISEAVAGSHLGGSFRTLSVTVVNGGVVESNPDGINCTAATCSYDFVVATIVKLRPIGTGFLGWAGACTGTGDCRVTMNSATAVTATFAAVPPPATLTILPNQQGNGSGSVACSTHGGSFGACAASYPHGSALVLRATASSGSAFAIWSDGTGNATACNNTANDCALTLTADSAIRANFIQDSALIPVVASLGGSGTVLCSANGGAAAPCGSYPSGTILVLTAVPSSTLIFAGWSSGTGSAAFCNSTTGPCSFTLTVNTTIRANFTRPLLTVAVLGTGTVSSSPAGIDNCQVSCSATFNKGTTITLTGNAGVIGWNGGGCTSGGACTFTLIDHMGVSADFRVGALSPFAFEAYIKSANLTPGHFGTSAALWGDTLAVGAPLDGGTGAVYIFTRTTGGGWSQQAVVHASNGENNDLFGTSVALWGNTLAVGALGESSAATDINGDQANNSAGGSGAVYVFTRTGSTWSQQAYVKASNTEALDGFGSSVALSGDTLAVGAQSEDSNASGINRDQTNNLSGNSGAVYVFTRTATVWSQQAYVKASNPDQFDGFGASVALSGDTLAVGSPLEGSAAIGINGDQTNNNAGGSGAAYVFTRTGTVWSQQAYVKASNTGILDIFGSTVALSGDTLAVGAPHESSDAIGINGAQANNNKFRSGAVYIFTRTGSIWSQQAYVKASNTDQGDQFGFGLALDSDMLVVGAPFEAGNNGNQVDNSLSQSGAVYSFKRSLGLWNQQAYMKAPNAGNGDQFGSRLALSTGILAIIAPAEDSAATGVNGNQADNSSVDSGAVYVYGPQ